MTVLRYQAVNVSVTDAGSVQHFYNVEGGTIVFDENVTPYLLAELTLTLPMQPTLPPAIDQGALDALDPRNRLQAVLVATLYEYDEATGVLHSQNDVSAALNIEDRNVDWKAGTIAVRLTTDEFKLQTEANRTTEPVSFRAHQGSLIAVCNDVLAAAGVSATLDSSSVDADVTTTSAVTNMLDNPNVTGGYDITQINCTVDTNDTSWFASGTNSINLWSPTAADSYAILGPSSFAAGNFAFGMQPGHTYTLIGTGRVKTAGTGTDYPLGGSGDVHRARALVIHTIRPGGTFLSGYDLFASAQLPNVVGATARVSVTATIPLGSTAVFIRLYNGNTASQQIQWDALMLVEGDGKETDGVNLLTYFDGSTPATDLYSYAWSGTANQSSSSRTPLIDRTPDSLTLSPGQNYWSMLEPVLGAAGRRLLCDEGGSWRLVDGVAYSVPGTVVVQQSNATALSDDIDLTQPDTVYGSVVVKYTWVNPQGNTETYYDAAGTGSPTRLVEYANRSYPGPGVAAYILAKGQGRGRVMSTTAMSDFGARPYMGARVIAPYTQTQTGVASRISFDLGGAEMDVTTRGLIDTPDGAWVLAPDAVTWSEGNAATTWHGLNNDFSNLT
ncbi:hypothetical protein HII28_00365 [Planctomonas sp. JC2975]|uniref:hypothetical protein n=1 Tax=Planctomonas sp. JC2975 TaxID=2729626 RepID=UPI0014747EDC|nr:hypothetical protein [Planctomonas sp. JC2975]NNC10338.1 hypothetical protein [Planctomonas sp. JC2975]